jgi:hypothetical protein
MMQSDQNLTISSSLIPLISRMRLSSQWSYVREEIGIGNSPVVQAKLRGRHFARNSIVLESLPRSWISSLGIRSRKRLTLYLFRSTP